MIIMTEGHGLFLVCNSFASHLSQWQENLLAETNYQRPPKKVTHALKSELCYSELLRIRLISDQGKIHLRNL